MDIENFSEFFALVRSENNERFDLLVWPKERLKFLLNIKIFIIHSKSYNMDEKTLTVF